MKKASRILLIIGGALALVSILTMFIAGIVFLVQSELYIQWVEEFIKEYDPSVDTAGLREMVMAGYFCFVIALFWESIFSIALAVLCFVGAGAQKKGLYIAIIVFNVIGGVQILTLLGAIFGLVARKQESKVVAVQE